MTSKQFQQVKELYIELEPLTAQQRIRALDEKCADDSVVRSEVQKLLEPDGAAQSRLASVTRQIDAIVGPPRGASDSMIGQRVGSYEITAVVGQGGMGVVYLGQDMRLGRKAALKAVLPGGEHDSVQVERLRREARVLASLSHPNLATVYGLEESHGTLFIAMEFIEGKTLGERLGRGALPIPEALSVCEQIAAGLEAAHEAGVIHRDLKPANTMITAEGTVKVLDFGLAREVHDEPMQRAAQGTAPLTRAGAFMGTPAYASPEQARCERLDNRSDIYSFGSILYRCLAGRPSFEGETDRDLIEAILTHEPDWTKLPGNLPGSLLSILKRCLAKEPGERYRHIGDARLDLREARLARGWERREASVAPVAKVKKVLPWAVAAMAVLIAGFILWMRPARSDTRAAQRFDVTFPGSAIQADLERVQLDISPDGRDVVIAAKTLEGQALWMRSHADGQWRRIEQTAGGHRPFFSPDGLWVGFFADGHLFKRRPSGGGDPVKLTTSSNWYGATWADDGSLIYSAAWGDPLQKLGPRDVAAKACTQIGSGEISHINPSAVSGSKWVLYNVWSGGEQADVHATHLENGTTHQVIVNASSPRVVATERGDYLLFERASIIFAAPFDRKTGKITGGEAAIVEGVLNDGTRFSAYFAAANDGTLVYFPGKSFAEESRLAYVNADRSTTPLNDDRMSFCEPVFSGKSKQMAMLVKGKLYRALVYDLERRTREFIVTGGDTLSVALSPDGQTLACTVNRDGGYGIDLFSLVDGRRLGRIVQPGADYQTDLSWSADGKLLAYSMTQREGTPNDVWVVEPRVGATPRALVSSTSADTKPAISPDGKWIAYASDVSGKNEIYLINYPEGTTTRQVTLGGGTSPAWSPSGESLYYIGASGLVSVKITPGGTTSGQAVVVYDKPFGQSDPIAREYTIAPDGRPLIIEPSERRPTVSHLQVITNWQRLLP